MKISHEMPLWMMKEGYDEALNDYSYALVHLFKESEEYRQHFVDALVNGREVILDNSIFELEEAFEADAFIEQAESLVADANLWFPEKVERGQLVIVIPDVLDDRAKTYKQADEFFRKLVDKNSHLLDDPYITWMAVAQGETMQELEQSFIELQLLLHSRVYRTNAAQKTRIGISFNCKAYESRRSQSGLTKLQLWSSGRTDFIHYLTHVQKVVNTPIHLLGCSVPQEFREYINNPHIVSIDTSNPIVHGLKGIRYKSDGTLRSKESIKLADMMFIKTNYSALPDILYNCRLFRDNTQKESLV